LKRTPVRPNGAAGGGGAEAPTMTKGRSKDPVPFSAIVKRPGPRSEASGSDRTRRGQKDDREFLPTAWLVGTAGCTYSAGRT
jgi:hypothetical protein